VKPPAPLFVHSFDLAGWVLAHFAERGDALSRELCARTLALLDHITLALQGQDRAGRLDEADETLVGVRLRLRLAEQLGWLDERQLMHALELADAIGRQIGGWQKSLAGP
jgi:hypothetical protein